MLRRDYWKFALFFFLVLHIFLAFAFAIVSLFDVDFDFDFDFAIKGYERGGNGARGCSCWR